MLLKLKSVFLGGTLEIGAAALANVDELVIEADHIMVNTGAQEYFVIIYSFNRNNAIFSMNI